MSQSYPDTIYTCEAPDAAGGPRHIAESKAIRHDDI